MSGSFRDRECVTASLPADRLSQRHPIPGSRRRHRFKDDIDDPRRGGNQRRVINRVRANLRGYALSRRRTAFQQQCRLIDP
jgi:hypothetical protein